MRKEVRRSLMQKADANSKEVSRCKEVVTKAAFWYPKCGSHCRCSDCSPVIGLEMRVFFVFPLPDSSLWVL
jgi:hypothetical protein